MKRILLFTVVALAVGVLAPTAPAGLFQVSMSDGTTTVTITDNGGGDTNPAPGAIQFNQVIGNWILNSGNGITNPWTGLEPEIDLSSLNVTNSVGGTMTLKLTDTGFFLPSGGSGAVLQSEIGGTIDAPAGSTLTATQILDRGNLPFGTGGPTVSVPLGPFVPGAFSGTASIAAPVADGALFSLTDVIVITHRGAGNTSFNADSHVVPVPGAILLGFLGLGAAGLKLRRFA